MKKKVWVGISLTLVIILMIGISVYRQAFAGTPGIKAVTVQTENISSLLMIPGTVELESTQDIFYSAEMGEIKKIMVKEENIVKKGEVLATLENPQMELEYEQNELAMESAAIKINQLNQQAVDLKEKEKDSLKQLGKKETEKLIKPERQQLASEQKMANLDLKQLKLTQDMLRKQQKELSIISQITGTILQINQAQGLPGDTEPFIRIGNLDSMVVKGVLSEYDTLKVKKKQSVTLKSDAVSDKEWLGEISHIAALPDKNTTVQGSEQAVQYPITVQLKNNDILKPGFQLFMEIETESKKALVVPMESVFEEKGKQYVYKLKDKKAAKQEVTIGITAKDKLEVISGVSNQDRVAADAANVKNGMEVDIQ
ncbi:efflux RND transporter periplasmic adaptor subunit [Peribacillus psychrosaccharolyticus]|uniref:Efflux RND transporter periplasmic adaptor subunit n=2 Tax=Peribacillus psychrosaccharolyticus TaxID=1407 RepID=A0A974S125_PERPY|nr:efflux RND transporter periplasmic adaptor subunit [Peribacillus psychrosaccharolyticus]MEC2057255.1 efflux RND transporter periplasmic adaptor subunit [Peribacillus psychrosaccharolyticus]QQT01018.1 efflux RND transporter periplasmic adaptor subunit [Peribacillus psychrosaccharolyticus]